MNFYNYFYNLYINVIFIDCISNVSKYEKIGVSFTLLLIQLHSFGQDAIKPLPTVPSSKWTVGYRVGAWRHIQTMQQSENEFSNGNTLMSNSLFINRSFGNRQRWGVEAGLGYMTNSENVPKLFIPDVGGIIKTYEKVRHHYLLPSIGVNYVFARSINQQLSHSVAINVQMFYKSETANTSVSYSKFFVGLGYKAVYQITPKFSVQLLANVNRDTYSLLGSNNMPSPDRKRYMLGLHGGIVYHF